MRIRVKMLYFGQARDESGRAEEAFSLDAGSTIRTLAELAMKEHPALLRLRATAKFALNEEIAGGSETLEDGDVVALLPPVAGG
ncbi:MAG: molybdopterin converting factor subunit 1 [Nitrososphaerota archaeon]|nr:molybdopterin converting factor subunit 1 [Nitrososphaerota archaeon]